MAQSYVNTGTQGGNFDGLVDILVRAAYEETPFLSSIGRTKAIASVHKWTSEDLNAARSNARAEGFTASYASTDVKKRTTESNQTELIAREFSFSDTQEAVKKSGGIVSDYDHEKSKKIKEISLDLDLELLTGTYVAEVPDSGTAGAMRGLVNALSGITSNIGGAIISTDIYDAFVQTIVDAGVQPDAVWCAGFNRRMISSWALPQRAYNDDNTTMNNLVLKYNGSWGIQSINYDKHMTTSKIAIVRSRDLKAAYLIALEHVEMGRDGSLKKGMVQTQATLEYGSTRSGGIITNTATAGV